MKIVCEDEKEYKKLMKACEYLHDFDFHSRDPIDFDRYKILSLIAHLYLEGKDFPDKTKFVQIKGRKTLPLYRITQASRNKMKPKFRKHHA